jgi:hypothetical protein
MPVDSLNIATHTVPAVTAQTVATATTHTAVKSVSKAKTDEQTDTTAGPQIITEQWIKLSADSLPLDSMPIIKALDAIPDTIAEVAEPEPEPYTVGLEGVARAKMAGNNSMIITVLMGMFLLLAFSFKHFRRLFNNYIQELWSVRNRANVFDEHTANETRVLVLLILQLCMFSAILLYSWLNIQSPLPPERQVPDLAIVTGIMVAYYVFQLVAYNLVGFTFSDNLGRKHWIQGFNASQSLLALASAVPTLVIIFYPDASMPMLYLAAGLYIVARLIFISKGFRIFYSNIGSLLYFILYLCTLEIIPTIIVYAAAKFLLNLAAQ